MSRRPRVLLALAIVAYTVIFTFYCWRRHASLAVGDWDLGIFDQSFWTAARAHLPFWNAAEGRSHFAYHCSPIFLLLLPIYALAPATLTLLILQSLALALGAVPVYYMARDRLSPRAGLVFAGLYLLYFPLHGVNYHDFHEAAFVVAPFMAALWGMRTGRRGWLWAGSLLALAGREDMGVVVALLGMVTWAWGRDLRRADAVGLVLVGLAWTAFAYGVVMPHFGGATGDVQGARLSNLGAGPVQWLLSPVARPHAFWGGLLRDTTAWYLLGLLAPLAFLPLWGWPALIPALPILLVNVLSPFGGMHLFDSHYAAPLIPFVFGAGIEGAARRGGERVLRPAVILTLLTAMLLDPSPLHLGRPIPSRSAHGQVLAEVAAAIPPTDSVAAPVNLWTHLDHRVAAYPFLRDGVRWIVVDTTAPEFMREGGFDHGLPALVGAGKYRLARSVDGVRVYRGGGTAGAGGRAERELRAPSRGLFKVYGNGPEKGPTGRPSK